MPRTPILDRQVLVETLPDGSMRETGMNLVNTTVGGGIEPTPAERAGTHAPTVADSFDNKFEASVNGYTQIRNDGSIEILQLTNGLQTPASW